MPGLTLKSLLSRKSGSLPAVTAILKTIESGVGIFDSQGKLLLGEECSESQPGSARVPVEFENTNLGSIVGPAEQAQAVALLLAHFAARESECRALAAEVLHFYREVHLIEQLSEQLAALLNADAVSQSALAQAQRLITATHGCVLVSDKEDGVLRSAASFSESPCDSAEGNGPLAPDSNFAASVLERGTGEIVNDCAADPRALQAECTLHALICAPLRAGQRNVGVIALASTKADASYTAADLKLLNTISLQTAAAIENSLLCVEMVETARERAAYAAELQAASSVQQMLLQSASSPTPGFCIDSVYVPASEVGGDFFFVSPAPDGSLTAIIGDVSGKGLTAAMRVAMILGALRRETVHDPGKILEGLNNVLIAQGQLGFTTACCIRIALSGEFVLANAGHIAPYLSGIELNTPPALPLGLVPDQTYELVHGHLKAADRLVLLSDGVPEARSKAGDLYGFDLLPQLTLRPAQEIADTAQRFGQEDDITVLTLTCEDPKLLQV